MSKFYNDDPFAKWNSPMDQDDPWKPWNNPMYQDDPFAPWNSPMANDRDYQKYCDEHRIPRRDR